MLEAEAHASTIANLKNGLEDKAQEIARLESAVRTLQHSKDQAIECVDPFPFQFIHLTTHHPPCCCPVPAVIEWITACKTRCPTGTGAILKTCAHMSGTPCHTCMIAERQMDESDRAVGAERAHAVEM